MSLLSALKTTDYNIQTTGQKKTLFLQSPSSWKVSAYKDLDYLYEVWNGLPFLPKANIKQQYCWRIKNHPMFNLIYQYNIFSCWSLWKVILFHFCLFLLQFWKLFTPCFYWRNILNEMIDDWVWVQYFILNYHSAI